MKKILLLIAALSVAMLFASCKKDDNKKIDDEDVSFEWRGVIERLADAWDVWDLTYNGNGTIKKVVRQVEEGQDPIIWNWDWAGDGTLQAFVVGGREGKDQITIYRSADGTISSMNMGDDTYAYTYDANGIMTEAKKNGYLMMKVTVANGNVTKLEHYGEGGTTTFEFEYGTEDNAEGFMLHWFDQYINKAYPSWRRFLVEGGLFGKGPAKRPVSVKIDNVSYDFAYDAPAIVDGYEVLGWSIPGFASKGEWDLEVHKYMHTTSTGA